MSSQQGLNYVEVEFVNKGNNSRRKLQVVQDDTRINYTTVVVPKATKGSISTKPRPPLPSKPPPTLQEENDLIQSKLPEGENRGSSDADMKRLGAHKGLKPVPKHLGKSSSVDLPRFAMETTHSSSGDYANVIKKPGLKPTMQYAEDNYIRVSPQQNGSKVESGYQKRPDLSGTKKSGKEVLHSSTPTTSKLREKFEVGGISEDSTGSRPAVRTGNAQLGGAHPSSNLAISESNYVNVVLSKLDVQAKSSVFEPKSDDSAEEKRNHQSHAKVSPEIQRRTNAIRGRGPVPTKRVNVPLQDSFGYHPATADDSKGKILDHKTDLPADFRRRVMTTPDAYSRNKAFLLPSQEIEVPTQPSNTYMNVAIEGKQNLPSYENFCPDIKVQTSSKPNIIHKKKMPALPSEKHVMGLWYHGCMDQPTAENLLQKKGIDRSYFVRQPQQEHSDNFCLSLLYKGKAHHLPITYNEKMHLFSIGNIKKFQNIEELLNHYTKKAIPNQPYKDMLLGTPLIYE